MRFKTRLGGALAALAVAAALAAPAALAVPIDSGPHARTPEVAPPPSSIAASAGREYEALRARDAGSPTVADAPSPSGGFDVLSAVIGAAAAAGLALVSVAAVGMRRRTASA
jgi:hypothetical protein